MTQLNSYQIALVVVLILNLLFWLLVICFRLFFNFSGERQQWNRRRLRGHRLQNRRSSSNRSLITCGSVAFSANAENTEGQNSPFTITDVLDAPPSYEDATKYTARRVAQMPSQYMYSEQRMTTVRGPIAYEQPVTLMVPEEPTSIAETRILTSLSTPQIAIRSETVNSPATSAPLSSSISYSPNIINNRSLLDPTTETDEQVITFVLTESGSHSVRLTGANNLTTQLTDGNALTSQSQA